MFVDLPVSGIHRLFTAGSSQSFQSYKPPPLESVTEESHTYDLLYPDYNALQQSQDHVYPLPHGNPSSIASAASSFDDRGGLDIQSPRDVRILVAQDGNIAHHAKVLYDTHPPPPLPAGRLGSPIDSRGRIDRGNQQLGGISQRTNTTPQSPTGTKHTRFFSFSQATHTRSTQQRSPLSPAAEPQGGFGSSRSRRINTRPATSEGETDQTKAAREGKEEVEALLDSMFGSTGTPLLSGTKLHVRTPTTTQPGATYHCDPDPKTPETDVLRRGMTPSTRSTTADDIHLMSSSAPAESANLPRPRSQNPSVLVTRLFSADPSALLSPRLAPVEGQQSAVNSEAHQDSQQSRESLGLSEMAVAKQIKCPTYAISVLVRLPSNSQQAWFSAPQVASPILPESPTQSSFPVGRQRNDDKILSVPLCSTDRDVEQITVHWSLVSRLLDSLEAIMRKEISSLLANVARTSLLPPLHSSAQVSYHDMPGNRGSHMKKVRQPSQRIIQLPVNALHHSEDIGREVGKFGQRFAVALRTRRVATGQGRWGVWREEARWVGRWAGGREQNFFFFNLLTAFLGSHTEWLESLVCTRTSRFQARPQARREAGRICRRQTVIVSADKMAARRLIFLLSAFLPSTAPPLHDTTRISTYAWTGISFSQSPPSGFSLHRKQSLRREINRRKRGNRASQGCTGLHGRSLSFAGPEHVPDADADHAFQSSNGQHIRRASEARPIRSPALPLAAYGENTKRSSTTTTSTVVPDAAVPVAHFSYVARDPLMGTTPAPRPGSSGSLASLMSLKHNLYRSESNEYSIASTGSQSFSRWGSVVSGFWSSRRGSSTDDSEVVGPSPEGLGISGAPKLPAPTSSPGTLSRMVEEVEAVSQIEHQEQDGGHRPPDVSDSAIIEDLDQEQATTGLKALQFDETKRSPERPEVEPFPIKLSVDDDDGIIDVELPPLDSCASSFGSSGGSVGHCHTAASSLNERSSAFTCSPSKERVQPLSDSPTDVAGWLNEYNQDFTLQAVRPYPGFECDIKEAIKSTSAAQPMTKRPPNIDTATADWIDVMTTLVANTASFSVTRIRLQHRLKSTNPPHAGAPAPTTLKSANQDLEERIIEEPIMDMDPTLIDAVERVLAQSGHSSRVQSRAPSRASSPSPMAHRSPEIRSMATPRLGVPKSECKRLVLGALEEVVRSVQAEQDAGTNGARRISGEPVRSGEEYFPPDNTLREGVRKWLRSNGIASGGS